MSERIRVLHCLSSVARGGVERRRVVLAKRLDPTRYEQRVLARATRGDVVDALEEHGVPVMTVGSGRLFAPRPLLRAVSEAVRFRPHIVHGAVFEGLSLAVTAGNACGARIVIEETSLATTRSPRGRALFRTIVAASDACVAISPAVRDHLRDIGNIPERKITLIQNGIDEPVVPPAHELEATRRELRLSPQAFVVGSVCRLTDDGVKRVSDLIRASALLRSRCPELRVLVVGDGLARPSLECLSRELGVEDCVTFLGNREDTGRFYALMDVFTLLSSREGFGLVVAEAMFCGVPVVGAAVGGIKDSVVDGETGVLVPPFSPEAVAEALLTLSQRPELRLAMGEAGRVRAQRLFGAARYASDVDAFYTRLLDSPRRRLKDMI